MDDCATFGHPNVAGRCACGARTYPSRPLRPAGTPVLLGLLDDLVAVVAGVAVDADREAWQAGRKVEMAPLKEDAS